jgi:CHAD domain-containing protein
MQERPPRRGPSSARLVASRLRSVDAELAAAIPRVLTNGDEEAIHDLRVAIRRLRTLLKLARPVYGRFHADTVRAAFTVVHRATGALRDEEVLDETLDEVACDAPAFVAWKARRRARERSLRRGVVARIKAGELRRARRLLSALVTLPVPPKRDKPATRLARRALERARQAVEDQRDASSEDAVALHDLRIAYKELRYTAELLEAALPADLAAMREPASRFQKRLGEIHDADMALACVKRARGLDEVTRATVLTLLEGVRAKRVTKYLADMAPSVPADEEVTAVSPPRAPLDPRQLPN